MPVFLQDGFSEPTRCTQGLVCAPYVVGNLKENLKKSDTPNEKRDKFCDSQYVAAGIHELHICVCTGTSKHEY